MKRNSTLAFGCPLLALLGLVHAPVAAADGCAQWNVGGLHRAQQSNQLQGSVDIYASAALDLVQNGSQFSGTAISTGRDKYDEIKRVRGPVVGTVIGNAFEATIYWDNNTIGVYTGQVGPQGLIVGTTYDRNNPSTRADWHMDSAVPCAASTAAAAAPPAPPKPTVQLVQIDRAAGASAPGMTVCEAAQSARARNSPAAPGLEAQCRAQTAQSAAAVAPAKRGALLVQAVPLPAVAPKPVVDAAWRELNGPRGAFLASQDALATELRNLQAEGAARRGFDFGMAVTDGQTADGPGKQAIRAALDIDERDGFDFALRYSLDRNGSGNLAARGAAIIAADAAAASERDTGAATIARVAGVADAAVFYKLGFNIATALFGNPRLGAAGNTLMGPGSLKTRNAFGNGNASTGFDTAVSYHQRHRYTP
jgi:hypothetical protein